MVIKGKYTVMSPSFSIRYTTTAKTRYKTEEKKKRKMQETTKRNESNWCGGTGKSSLYCLFAVVVDEDVVWLYSVLFSVSGKVCIESCLVIKLAHMDFGHAEECATKRKTIRTAFSRGKKIVFVVFQVFFFFFKRRCFVEFRQKKEN